MSEGCLETSDLLFPTLQAKNQRGEIVFLMKRKGEKYGQLYYLFEFHWDRVDSNQVAKVRATWEVIKLAAANMGVPLFDINQVTEEIKKQGENLLEGEETKDISISIVDHATGEPHKLVIAVTKKLLNESPNME